MRQPLPRPAYKIPPWVAATALFGLLASLLVALPLTTAAASPGTDTAHPTSTGEMLGGDPRKESIYFAMTARFYDGDEENNRGGSHHEEAGNDEYDDPMFRGDFSGLIDRLDYIKGLGFSAVWITPVVLNRSDYDFHGYHGYDFYRVDPRLESEGADYQALIDAAHDRDMKIYQDVVFNHSSRWGAVGLETPTFFGVQDEEWEDHYHDPNPDFTYDGLTVEPDSGVAHYNGDLWSTEEPEDNTCENWGEPTGDHSPEGQTIYNCQWPDPTSGMFSEENYHQCWIGNWEGEDSAAAGSTRTWPTSTPSRSRAGVPAGRLQAVHRHGVDGFGWTRPCTSRVTWNRHFLPELQDHLVDKYGEEKARTSVFGEVAAFVHDRWNRGSVNHSPQFFTWKERFEYDEDPRSPHRTVRDRTGHGPDTSPPVRTPSSTATTTTNPTTRSSPA